MSYHHLSLQERYVIHHLKLIKLSHREIGRRLRRHHTTIGRELARNGQSRPELFPYWHAAAQRRCTRRHSVATNVAAGPGIAAAPGMGACAATYFAASGATGRRSRSPGGCAWTMPAIRACGSAPRPSTSGPTTTRPRAARSTATCVGHTASAGARSVTAPDGDVSRARSASRSGPISSTRAAASATGRLTPWREPREAVALPRTSSARAATCSPPSLRIRRPPPSPSRPSAPFAASRAATVTP